MSGAGPCRGTSAEALQRSDRGRLGRLPPRRGPSPDLRRDDDDVHGDGRCLGLAEGADENYGMATTLRVRYSAADANHGYLRFSVAGISGSVTSAKLRLYVADASLDGGSVYRVSDSWTEKGITWSNAPGASGTALSRASAVTLGSWVEFDLGSSVTGDGTYSFGLKRCRRSRRPSSRPLRTASAWQM